ncbi:MAG: hypothetical protein QM606_08045 [Leucobacter sp.]
MIHISLTSLSDELAADAEASGTGIAVHPVKTEGSMRQVAIRFREGGVLPEHDNPGEAMALVVEGAETGQYGFAQDRPRRRPCMARQVRPSGCRRGNRQRADPR